MTIETKSIEYTMKDDDEHKIHVFFDFRFSASDIEKLKSRQMSGLSDKGWLPGRIKKSGEKCPEQYDETYFKEKMKDSKVSVWDVSRSSYSNDLHQHIHTILSGTTNEKFDGMHLETSQMARQMFSGGYGNTGRDRLILPLSSSAKKRLNINGSDDHACLVFLLDNVELYLFRSGIGVAVASLSFDKNGLSIQAITEGVYELCHENQKKPSLQWQSAPKESGKAPFSLGAIVEDLIGENIQVSTQRRPFTFISLVLQEKVTSDDTIKTLGCRLSRKYTSDYTVNLGSSFQTGYEQSFKNIHHFCYMEGGAIIVNGTCNKSGDPVDFLQTYNEKAIKPLYLPVTILAYHEFRYLLNLSQNSAIFVDFSTPSHLHKEALESLRDKLLNFRLYYRFSYISSLSHHNAIYQRWRESLGLNLMLKEVTKDVEEVEYYLAQKLNEKVQRTGRMYSSIITALLIFLSLLQGLESISHTELGWIMGCIIFSVLIGFTVWKYEASPSA